MFIVIEAYDAEVARKYAIKLTEKLIGHQHQQDVAVVFRHDSFMTHFAEHVLVTGHRHLMALDFLDQEKRINEHLDQQLTHVIAPQYYQHQPGDFRMRMGSKYQPDFVYYVARQSDPYLETFVDFLQQLSPSRCKVLSSDRPEVTEREMTKHVMEIMKHVEVPQRAQYIASKVPSVVTVIHRTLKPVAAVPDVVEESSV